MELPQGFRERMSRLLGGEYPAFLASYDREISRGLRLNGWKSREGRREGWEREGSGEEADFLRKEAGFSLEPIPWVPEGYFYGPDCRPGRSPLHEAGVYYIQEPSAMAAAALLDPEPGDQVLDLCAAPGGKTTQIGSRLKGRGFLLSNEIHPARARILSQNVERMGLGNVAVTNHAPGELADRFPEVFDKIAVDAPCSGEGMFRREEEALAQWSGELIKACAERQREILCSAARMLRPGGRLVYSTCTFAPEENEGVLADFLAEHGDFYVERRQGYEEFSPGRPDWVEGGRGEEFCLERAFRLMPHRTRGEGHFVASLRKRGGEEESGAGSLRLAGPGGDAGRRAKKETFPGREPRYLDRKRLGDSWKAFEAFLEETFTDPGELAGRREYLNFGDQLYLAPPQMPDTEGLKILRPGLHMGTFKKNRFEPSHSLALWLLPEQALRKKDLPLGSPELSAYLRGESLPWTGKGDKKGWVLITTAGFSLGWAKLAGGVLKNHYPKGLRICL